MEHGYTPYVFSEVQTCIYCMGEEQEKRNEGGRRMSVFVCSNTVQYVYVCLMYSG